MEPRAPSEASTTPAAAASAAAYAVAAAGMCTLDDTNAKRDHPSTPHKRMVCANVGPSKLCA